MPRNHKQLPFLTQWVDLVLIELTNWRWSWRSMALLGIIAPVGSMLALSVFARDAGREALSYVLTGNVVLALMFENQDKLQSHFVYIRTVGTLDYFATLPIKKYALIVAIVFAFFLLSIPSLFVTILFGAVLLDIPLSPNPLLLLVVPLCAVPMAGIGALIGTSARNPQEAGSISLLVTLGMAGLGPVIIPPDRLPEIMLVLGRFSPATYAASALRQTLLGPVTPRLTLDLAALLLFTLVVFWVVGRKLDWRRA